MELYSEKIEALIKAALADGKLTDKERQVLMRKAAEEGIDPDEFEMVLDSKVAELQTGKPKQNQKIESIKRCPNCGAIITFESRCPECGFVFSSLEANASIVSLFDTLKQMSSWDNRKKRQVIEHFPIPNSKSDILAFLVAFKSKLTNPDDSFSSAYLSKYDECIEKAKVYFPNDPDFNPFIHGLSDLKKGLKKGSTKRWIKNHKILTGIIAFAAINLLLFLALIIGLIVSDEKEFGPARAAEKEVRVLIAKGDYENAKVEAQGITVKGIREDLLYDIASAEIDGFIAAGNYEGARQIARGFKPDKYSFKSSEDLLDKVTVSEIEALIENGLFDDARNKSLSIKSDYKREQTIDEIIKKEVFILVSNNQLEEALQKASTINSEYTRENTTDDIKAKLVEKYIKDGDLERAGQMAKTIEDEYTRNKYAERINKLQ